jgi:hypothetical protein
MIVDVRVQRVHPQTQDPFLLYGFACKTKENKFHTLPYHRKPSKATFTSAQFFIAASCTQATMSSFLRNNNVKGN